MAQNLPNGVPPQMNARLGMDRPNPQFNGVHSSQSSRDSSPLAFSGQIPSSQLPPSRPIIPSSQLPPLSSHSPINVSQKMGQLNINNTTTTKPFGSSTPNQTIQHPSGLVNSAFSPINPVKVGNSAGSQVLNQQARPTQGHVVPPQQQQLHRPPAEPIQPQHLQQQQKPMTQVVNNQSFPPNLGNNGPVSLNHNNHIPQQNSHIAPAFQAKQPNQQAIINNHNVPTRLTQPVVSKPPVNQQESYYNQPPNRQPANNMPAQQYEGNRPLQNQSPAFSQPQQQYEANKPVQNQNPAFSQPQQLYLQNFNKPMPQVPLLQPQFQRPGPQQQIQEPAPPQQIPQPFQQPPPQAQYKTNLHTNRYPQGFQRPQGNMLGEPPQMQQQIQQQPYEQMGQQFQQPQAAAPYNQFGQQPAAASVTQTGFNRLWGQNSFDLLQNPNVLPKDKVIPPKIYLGNETLDTANCSSDVFRCTMTKIPESNSLLQKSRLPLGVLIHPFRDLTHLPVIQCNVIVRCRTCRTYINPFVFFVDTKRWKCNLCYRVNELPEEFQYDPVSKTYGDPSRRPEIKTSTIEYIAPAEYMLRPPQPAVYLFLFDISRLAIESGYLQSVCTILLEELENLPGDARTQLGIIAYDSALHFFSLAEGLNQPHEMTVLDIDDIFLPCPDNLLINLKDRMDLLKDLLTQLPTRYNNTYDNNSALGAALQAAHKMLSATGGRVTAFQASIPNVGPGGLTAREDPSQRASSDVAHLNPANDFYKRLALECSGQQIAVDLFIVNSQYVDIATLSGICRFSGGCIHHFPLFKATRVLQSERLERCFRRYLIRKIGFEAVMRIRCTRGLSIHTFHGNFFVRSTDLLSLPNVNPDAGFGMQVSIEENLSDIQTVCFQAALLYTSSKGERRIRVHTLCLPICSTLSDVINSADQQCIVGLLSKMAVDRSMQSNLADAREAFINVAIDILSSYKLSLNMGTGISGLLAPDCLRVLPLYISALLKYTAFRTGTSTRLDDRVKAMIDMKTKPAHQLIQLIYPDLYPVHNLEEQPVILTSEEQQVHHPPHLQLSARCLDTKGAFLLDTGEHMVLLVCAGASPVFLNQILGVRDYVSISDEMYEMPILDNLHNQRLHQFINYLNDDKPFPATLQIIRDNSPSRVEFYERLIEDRVENALSYHEFLQHLKTQVK